MSNNNIDVNALDNSNIAENYKNEILKLDKTRLNIEKEIFEINDFLNQDGMPGVEKSLIDDEGYPLPNLDLYAIREARQKLIMLKNDHKNLMIEIENLMKSFFDIEKENRIINANINKPYKIKDEDIDKKLVQVFEENTNHCTTNIKYNLPFAKVTSVLINSPAFIAGIKEDDLIILFGSVNKSVINPLEKIGNIVKINENKNINIEIIRKETDINNKIQLNLIPQKWEGNGLLGCKLSIL